LVRRWSSFAQSSVKYGSSQKFCNMALTHMA
jgi:hypothetical protein